jgi:hypothetical protein
MQAGMSELLHLIQVAEDTLKPFSWFLPQTIILYAGLIASKRIAAIPLRTITLILTPLCLFPLYYWETFDPAWYIKVLLWFLMVILGYILKIISSAENEHFQLKKDRRTEYLKEKIVKLDDPKNLPSYFLYLKPLAVKQHLDTQTKEHFDLENVLRSALDPIDLIPLENPSEMIDVEQIFIPNSEWQAKFEKLAINAKSILFIPSYLPDALWEIKWLIENRLLPRCLWLMPETPGWSNTFVNFEVPTPSPITISEGKGVYDYSAFWGKTVEAMKVVGIKLPPYQDKGMVFVIDENGTASAFQLLALSPIFFRVRKVRKALRNLKNPKKSSKENAYAPPSEPGFFSKVKENLLFTVIGAGFIGYGLYQEFHNGFSWSMLFFIAFGAFFLLPFFYSLKE